ncbi:MAG: hypothetical protein JSR62_12555 [Nitrospira sp.]|nr:hypothetical protein [Nitrospira sp.]
MKTVLDIAVPIVAFLIMIPVGLELTVTEFRKLSYVPGMVTAALVGQILLLPLFALGLVHFLNLKPHILTGLLLIAACPAGGLSNYYAYVARARTALSVALTAGSCFASLGTMPLVTTGYGLYLDASIDFAAPVGRLMGHLLGMLVLPVLFGMALRHYRPVFATRHEATLRRLSLVGLAFLLAYVLSAEGARVAKEIPEMVAAAGMFLALAMATGYTVGICSGGDVKDAFTLLIEFAVRNVAIATAIAVTVLGRIEFATFAAAYFVIETPILFAAVLIFKLRYGSATRIPVQYVP